jgi:hypothetical protein
MGKLIGALIFPLGLTAPQLAEGACAWVSWTHFYLHSEAWRDSGNESCESRQPYASVSNLEEGVNRVYP